MARENPILNPRIPAPVRVVLRHPYAVFIIAAAVLSVVLGAAGVPTGFRFGVMVAFGMNYVGFTKLWCRPPIATTWRTQHGYTVAFEALSTTDADLRRILRRVPRHQRGALRDRLDTLSWRLATLLRSDFDVIVAQATDMSGVEAIETVRDQIVTVEGQLHQLWCGIGTARWGIDAATARTANALDDDQHPSHVTAELVEGALGADRDAVEQYVEHTRKNPYRAWKLPRTGRYSTAAPNSQKFNQPGLGTQPSARSVGAQQRHTSV